MKNKKYKPHREVNRTRVEEEKARLRKLIEDKYTTNS